MVDDELCAFVERFCQGIAVNDDTLAMNIISEVGAGGDFLGHQHTVRHCRSGEMWYPTLLDRSSVGAPAPDLYERAHARVEEILAQHRPAVGEALRRELEFYVARAF